MAGIPIWSRGAALSATGDRRMPDTCTPAGPPGLSQFSAQVEAGRAGHSFEAADEADAAEQFNMTPERRVAIMVERRERYRRNVAGHGPAPLRMNAVPMGI
jgi:hypothetical protein